MYPRIEINLQKLNDNTKTIVKMCKENNINSIFFVTKVLAGNINIIKSVINSGITHLADSRIQNLIKLKKFSLPKVLLRIPMQSEASKVVRYTDISLNSEISTIKKLNDEAKKQNKIHNIILMFDLGDLREGIFFQDEYLKIVEEILLLTNIKLLGIGTNLTCYGGVIPCHDNLSLLVDIKNYIEEKFSYKLEIISGGNSSTIHLFNKNIIPKAINNLRIGEAIVLGRETAYGDKIQGMHPDVFTLKAELIEVKDKPSYPIGNIGMDSFGEIPKITDKGIMKRGILAIGKQDIALNNLIPNDRDIEIIGGSSDHLICDLKKSNYHIGDVIEFSLNYPGLLQLMTSGYVKKILK